MNAGELDRLFAAIRRTRDPELLATLFERTAPWLLHRARLLLGRDGLAEDVVQDLFLALLEHGHRCEPGRPCLPYLIGMLRRLAARVQRREARTLAQGLREETSVAGAAVDAAISAEGRAAVRAAIDALPEPYRDVVRRFLAQQSTHAIGRELGRTPNSVRVLLHRGLRLLRCALPPGLLALLLTVPARPIVARVRLRRQLGFGAAVLAIGAVAVWAGIGASPGNAFTVGSIADVPSLAAAAVAPADAEGDAAPVVRNALEQAAGAALVLELHHADGSPAESVGVLAHPAGRDADFDACRAVSGVDGRVMLEGLAPGPATVLVDRGLRLLFAAAPIATAPHFVVLPEGVDVTGIVRDAQGRPAAGAGIWLCLEPRRPTEGSVVARAGADGRFIVRGVQAMASIAAVREGSAPSQLRSVDGVLGELELVLGGEGARLAGRVFGGDGAPIAGAVVRVARNPRANFQLPGGRTMEPAHPCAVARTDAAGTFALADLPPGPMQVLVRAPGCSTKIEPVIVAPGVERRVDLRMEPGADLCGDVRDESGSAIAAACVMARGVVPSAWASADTAPDGSFALTGLDDEHVLLEVAAPGFVPASVPVESGVARIAVVLLRETRVLLRLRDAAGACVAAPEWELAACPARGGQPRVPTPLEAAGDTFVAAGEFAEGPFMVRRQGAQVWLRAELCEGDPMLLQIPAAAHAEGSLVLSLPGTTPQQCGDVLLVLERDGVRQPIFPVRVEGSQLDFGPLPVGETRAVLYSRTGSLPALDLGVIAIGAMRAPHTIALPQYGWLRYSLRSTDREPVLDCLAFVLDERGLQVPLEGPVGRVALAAGRYQIWVSSLSFPTIGDEFVVAAGQETAVDLELNPGKVRHVAFRLPPETDLRQCRARVLAADGSTVDDEHGFPIADRGFDTAADGICSATIVLAEGQYVLDVRCGQAVYRARFGVAAADGVVDPIEVELRVER
ncbi:MAG TPA: sigma-70 family RNA polymerase sigma factor [Planctomycetota bacterium]|nr:sigma-70 family RNA polymerase sigma factor [Planctomycetota bacterium]